MRTRGGNFAFFLWIFLGFFLAGVSAKAACPNSKEIVQLLEADLRDQARRERDLKALLASQPPGPEASLDEIFGVDLHNREVVEELKAKGLGSPPTFALASRFPKCQPAPKNVTTIAAQLDQTQKRVHALKAQFLELDANRRSVLVESFRTAQQQSQSSAELSEAKERAAEHLKEAIREQEVAEKSASAEKDDHSRKLAEARSNLEDRKIKLSEEHLRLTARLEEENSAFLAEMTKLQGLSLKAESASVPVLLEHLATVNSLWRKYVDTSLNLAQGAQIPELPPLRETLAATVGGESAQAYRKSYAEALQYRQEITTLEKESRAKRTVTHYKLVVQSGRVRSQYLGALLEAGERSPFDLTSETLPDFIRELQIVPFRFISLIQAKTADVRGALGRGLGGIVGLVKDTSVFFLFLLMPFALFWCLSRVGQWVEKFRANLIRPPFHRNPRRVRAALLLQRITPFLPWLLGYFTVWISEDLLAGTLWEELAFALPYVRFYILYRIFLIVLQSGLSNLGRFSNFGNLRQLRLKATKTGRLIGLFFLILFCILHATETTVGRALVFQLVEQWMFFLGWLVLLLSPLAWREEIRGAAQNLGNPTLSRAVEKMCSGPISVIGSALSLAIVSGVLFYRATLAELSDLETFKRLSAKLLRRRLEATGAHGDQQNIEKLPDDYTAHFGFGVPTADSVWVDPPGQVFQKIRAEVTEWIDDKTEENTLAVFGEKGAGKSSLFELIHREFNESLNVKMVTVPPKICSAKEALKFFEKLLEVDLSDGYGSLIEADTSRKKTLFLLDDAHNFFVADFGGFEGFRKFLELTNVRLENCYFAASFNIHSWNYLDSVFGRNRFFRTLYSLNTWEEEDIRKLVLSRHQQSGFKLVYDPVVFAAPGANYESDFAEVRYFRMLWEQACGNPRSALYLWLTSLKKRGNQLKVTLPEDTDSDALIDLQQDAYFIYSSIVRHENLTSEEAMRTTDLPEGTVRHALKVGLERRFLFRSDGRYRVSAGWHNTVVNFLTKRNFIHGN